MISGCLAWNFGGSLECSFPELTGKICRTHGRVAIKCFFGHGCWGYTFALVFVLGYAIVGHLMSPVVFILVSFTRGYTVL